MGDYLAGIATVVGLDDGRVVVWLTSPVTTLDTTGDRVVLKIVGAEHTNAVVAPGGDTDTLSALCHSRLVVGRHDHLPRAVPHGAVRDLLSEQVMLSRRFVDACVDEHSRRARSSFVHPRWAPLPARVDEVPSDVAGTLRRADEVAALWRCWLDVEAQRVQRAAWDELAAPGLSGPLRPLPGPLLQRVG